MTHTPHDPHSPSRSGVSSNHVVTLLVGVVVLGCCMPHYLYAVQSVYLSYNYVYVARHSQNMSNYNVLFHPFMGHARGGYYLTRKGNGLYYNQA